MTKDFNYKLAHQDYLAICKMNCSPRAKRSMLDAIICEWEGCWRVVGITQAALHEFLLNDFCKKTGMKINRSHIMDRKDRGNYLLENIFTDADEWWNYITSNDTTYLATSSENISGNWSKVIPFTNLPDTAFQSAGFGWKHRKGVERIYLKNLYEATL